MAFNFYVNGLLAGGESSSSFEYNSLIDHTSYGVQVLIFYFHLLILRKLLGLFK